MKKESVSADTKNTKVSVSNSVSETTKEQERQQLYKAIWNIANDLRGAVDGWDFKAYVMGMMAYRYLSEHFAGYVNNNERESGKPDFNYADLSDEYVEKGMGEEEKRSLINTLGYFILPSQLFENVEKNCEENDTLNLSLYEAFSKIQTSGEGTSSDKIFKDLFIDVDVNSNKLGINTDQRNARLRKILHAIAGMDLGGYSDTGILDYNKNATDIFGDTYEYLMAMYASNAGKSGGEFYTPQEVSELLVGIVTENGTKKVFRCYDPTCGSGSLLLKFLKAKSMKERGDVILYGQEINLTAYNLCCINMLLHGINFSHMCIRNGDTLTDPNDDLNNTKPFEAIVSNPPYSVKWIGEDSVKMVNDPRFAGPGRLAPKGKADLAFVMHCLHRLSSDGIAAIVCFPGVLYRTGAEAKIRQWLIGQGYISSVIQLPEKLFFGTGIATSILVLKKDLSDNKVLFIDASKQFTTGTNQNKLSPENISFILKVLSDRGDVQYISKLCDKDAIAANDYNLSVSMYVEKEDTREKIDIHEVNAELDRLVKSEKSLRTEVDAIVAGLVKGA